MPFYRLLALDLDGTLLDQRLEFSSATRSAIADAQAVGVAVTLATGRMERTTRPFADQLGITLPLICYQGAQIRAADGTVLHEDPVPTMCAADLIQHAIEHDFYIQVYYDDALWIQERRPELNEYLGFSLVEIPVHVVPNLADFAREHPPTKLLWIADHATLGHTIADWGERWADKLSIFRSHDRFGEASSPTASKGTALAALAQHLGIERDHVAAIGDRQNDAPMLKWAGLGLAMGNADEYARSAADHVLPSFDDDGAAWGIRHWILGNEE